MLVSVVFYSMTFVLSSLFVFCYHFRICHNYSMFERLLFCTLHIYPSIISHRNLKKTLIIATSPLHLECSNSFSSTLIHIRSCLPPLYYKCEFLFSDDFRMIGELLVCSNSFSSTFIHIPSCLPPLYYKCEFLFSDDFRMYRIMTCGSRREGGGGGQR